MVVVNRMAELVQQDEIYQLVGQEHQVEAKRQIVAARAAAPLAHRGTNRDRAARQPRAARKFCHARRKQGLGLGAQGLDYRTAGDGGLGIEFAEDDAVDAVFVGGEVQAAILGAAIMSLLPTAYRAARNTTAPCQLHTE